MSRHWKGDDLEAHLAAERMEKRREARLSFMDKPELINDCCVSCGKIGGTTPHLSGPRDPAGNRSCPDYMGCIERQKALLEKRKREAESPTVERLREISKALTDAEPVADCGCGSGDKCGTSEHCDLRRAWDETFDQPEPRLSLVAHIRDKIAQGAYDGDRVLEAAADAFVRSTEARDLCEHGTPHHDCTEHNTKETD